MKHTVLVVDDEASIADGLRLTLEAEGYSVRIAGSVRTALSAVAQAEAHVAMHFSGFMKGGVGEEESTGVLDRGSHPFPHSGLPTSQRQRASRHRRL